MVPSGVNAGSKLWTMAPLLVHPSEPGVAAMRSFLAQLEPSTLTVQISNGSPALLRAANATLSPFHETDG